MKEEFRLLSQQQEHLEKGCRQSVSVANTCISKAEGCCSNTVLEAAVLIVVTATWTLHYCSPAWTVMVMDVMLSHRCGRNSLVQFQES